MRQSHDYNKAIDIIKENHSISRDDLGKALIADMSTSAGSNALSFLRSLLKKDNIVLKYDAKTAVYYIEDVKNVVPANGHIKTAKTKEETMKNLSSLEKDNKSLFIENENLKSDLSNLQEKLSEAYRMVNDIQEKYNTLMDITRSMSKLAGISA